MGDYQHIILRIKNLLRDGLVIQAYELLCELSILHSLDLKISRKENK